MNAVSAAEYSFSLYVRSARRRATESRIVILCQSTVKLGIVRAKEDQEGKKEDIIR